jgi:NitT/TauT family transport system substrate-binding protein
MLLRSGGLTVDDVQTEYIPPVLKPEGFERDIIDVTTSSEPYMTRILDAGSAVKWMPFYDVVPGYQYGFMLFGPSLLKDHPELGRRFMRAYLRAVRQYNSEGKTPRHLEILSKQLRLDVEFLKRTCWPYHANDGQIDIERLNHYQDWALAEGFVDRKLTVEELWDRSFVDHANRVLDGAE